MITLLLISAEIPNYKIITPREMTVRIIIGFVLIIVFSAIGLIAYDKDFKPVISLIVFEQLVQVIAIVFGFSVVAIFFYLGKIHDDHLKYLESFNAAVGHMRKAHLERSVDQLELLKTTKEISSKAPDEFSNLAKEIENDMKESEIDLEKRLSEMIESRNEEIKSFRLIRATIQGWARLTFALYSIAILITFIPLLTEEIQIEFGFIVLMAVTGIVVSAVFFFIQISAIIHLAVDLYSDIVTILQNYVLIERKHTKQL